MKASMKATDSTEIKEMPILISNYFEISLESSREYVLV